MKILVTGAAGFIGSNYCRWLLENTDDEITGLDALRFPSHVSTVHDLRESPRFTWLVGDIRDAGLCHTIIGHDAVVHFAAESHVDRSIAGPTPFVAINCEGTTQVMEACRWGNVSRIVHISTDEVYGSLRVGESLESDPLDPRSPYAASKAGSDLIARSFFSTYDLPVMITRSSNNFGSFQYPEKLIPLFVTNLLEGKKVPLYGDGYNWRDWLYVADNCAAIDLVLRAGVPGEIYNIGAGNDETNLSLTQRLLAMFHLGEDMIEYVDDRLGHDFRYAVNTDKIQSLGWAPQTAFDDALEATVKWYKDNSWWWKHFKR